MKTYQYIDIEADGGEWVPAEAAQRLYEALEKVDKDLENRNYLENSSLRRTVRAALAAADGENK